MEQFIPQFGNIKGYDTIYAEMQDNGRQFLMIAVPANAEAVMANIVGETICGHFIKEVEPRTQNGAKFIFAYY